jgi:hypothetical protein
VLSRTLNAAHKLQIGTQLLESTDGYCYVHDGAESLQSEWLAQLLSKRGTDGKLRATALDLSLLHSKTSEAQHEAMQATIVALTRLASAPVTASPRPSPLTRLPAPALLGVAQVGR